MPRSQGREKMRVLWGAAARAGDQATIRMEPAGELVSAHSDTKGGVVVFAPRAPTAAAWSLCAFRTRLTLGS